MAKKLEIEITIDEDGTEHIEAKGFEGPTCSAEIGKFLTGTVVRDQKKSEYHRKAENTVKQGKP